jgi:hypothetical protein
MLYQLSYASPKNGLLLLTIETVLPPGNLPRKPMEFADTLLLHAYHGTEFKVSTAEPPEQTSSAPARTSLTQQ